MNMTIAKFRTQCDFLSKIFLVLTGFIIPLSVTGFSIFLTLTLVFFLLADNLKNKLLLLRHNQVLGVALFIFLLLLISISYTTAPSDDIAQSLGKYSKFLYLIFLMPLFVEEKWRNAGINAFLAAMAITLITAFLKSWGWLHLGKQGSEGTLFTNHINTGFIMAFAAFILAHRCYLPGRYRWFYLVWFLLTVYFLFFMNEGRTGYLVFLALFLLFLYQKFHWKGLAIAVCSAPLLLSLLFFTSSNFQQRIRMVSLDWQNYQQQKLANNSIGLRTVFIKNSLHLVKQHPVFGTGVGSFRNEYAQYFPPDPGFAGMRHPQTDYLLIAVQLGGLGLLVFLWLFYVQWRTSLRLPFPMRHLAQGFVVTFLAGMACDSMVHLAIPGYFFVYFTALFFAPTAETQQTKARHTIDPRYPLKLDRKKPLAFVMSPRLGDCLISMVVVNNLQRNGFQISVFSDLLSELKTWFPGFDIHPYPLATQLHEAFSRFEVVLHAFQVDIRGNMKAWHPGTYVLEHSSYNWLRIPMVDIQVMFCKRLLGLQNVIRDNGMIAPAGLIAHRFAQRVVIHPTSQQSFRSWLPRRFYQLAKQLTTQHWQPAFIVSNAERSQWLWIEKQGFLLPIFSSLSAVADYIYESAWFIGNDSGIGHLASAMGTPTLTLGVRANLLKRWRPSWAPGLILLPPFWLVTRPLKEKLWKYCISVKQVLKAFTQLQKMA